MHWLGYNDAVSWLNEAKTQIFQPIANSSACQPAIRPGCTRCRAPEILHDKGNGGGFTKMLFIWFLYMLGIVIRILSVPMYVSSVYFRPVEE